MEWPKFDFAKYSYIQSQRLSSARKSNCGLKKNRSKTCRSLAPDFENITKKRSSTKRNIVQNESIITLHQQISPNSNPSTCARDLFQMNRKINTEKIPPLSPILINGFLKNATAYSPAPLKDSNLNVKEMLISMRTDSVNLVATNTSHCEDPIILESPEPVFIPLHFSLQRSKVIPRNQTFTNQSKLSTSFATAAKESGNLNSKCWKNGKTNHSPKLHASSKTAVSISAHSLDNSLISLETLPLFEIHRKSLHKNENSPNLNFINSQLSTETDESITIRHTRSNSDVLQNHTVCIDDSESVATKDEHSHDCFLDVIHEIEPNNPDFETKVFVQSISSPATNQLKIYGFQNESVEVIHQKQYHRLSKLAETLKKRLFIGSSDLVMWKCEEPKQHPVRQVTMISKVEQWGFCWTLVKNISDSEIAHIVDSEPMKRTAKVLSRYRNQRERNVGDDQESRRRYVLSQRTSEGTFCLYQPLSKLNTSSGEFILSPRYYR
ncbi:hypothetical protein LOAG_01896 [Loa loa]|nr:hypothetical protein LOAG_01896 [Loa loa]EFO26592.2 hypothetical protein LOAG_01896 [Loa loa]